MGILQERILEWVAMPSSRGPSQPSDRTQVFLIAERGKRGGFGLEKVLSVRVRSMDAHGLDRGVFALGEGPAASKGSMETACLAGRRGAGPSLDLVASCQCTSGPRPSGIEGPGPAHQNLRSSSTSYSGASLPAV